jgi:hypothetical protein
LLLAIAFGVLGMSAPVLAPILLMAFTPGALRTSLVIAVVRIALALAALPSPAAFALALATEALLRNLRAWPKTGPAGCTPPVPHGYTPRTDQPRQAMGALTTD